MIVAVFLMIVFIYSCCEITFTDAAYFGMIAFVVAEFMASFEWQVVCYFFDEAMTNWWLCRGLLVLIYGAIALIREFGKNEYEYFAELNFVTDERAADIFNGKLTAEAVITNLTAYLQTPLEPGKTLILFDEVQECPRVRSAIKFLVEDGRFDYIESGSLLGVRYKDVTSYPVGFEQILPMYPLDFEEYLWANGIQNHTLQYLKSCYDKKEKVSETIRQMCWMRF